MAIILEQLGLGILMVAVVVLSLPFLPVTAASQRRRCVSLKSTTYSHVTGRPESSTGVLGPVGFGRVDISQQGTQPVELVEEMQNNRYPFIVDAKIQLEIPDQPGPREIGFRELRSDAAGERYQPFLINPDVQCRGVKMRSGNEFLDFHGHTPIDCRGLSATGCHCVTNFSSSESGFCGRTSFSVTY